MKTQIQDIFPGYLKAGITDQKQANNAKLCIQPQTQRQSTPTEIKRFRQSYKQQEGKRILHHGIYNDQNREDDHLYGYKIRPGHKLSEMISQPQTHVQEIKNDIQESRYRSQKEQPLAKSISRSYRWPEQVKSGDFQYGLKSDIGEHRAMNLIFPKDNQIHETDDQLKNYVISHQSFQPGQQKQRNYQWYIDKQSHFFGKSTKIDNEINNLIFHDNFNGKFPETKICRVNQEDFKSLRLDSLQKSANLFQNNRYVDKDTIYGRKNQRQNDIALCVSGSYTTREVMPEDNLGRSMRLGYRNTPKQGDEKRVFGIPTIRTDIAKETRSLADPNNYGQEPGCQALIFPQKYTFMGLDNEDFQNIRSKQEEYLGKSVYNIKLENSRQFTQEPNKSYFFKFQQNNEQVSVAAFLQAVKEMHNQN